MYTNKLCKFLSFSALAWLLMSGTAWAAKTLDYTIRWDTDTQRYRVFMRSNATPVPDASMTAQVTIRVPHGIGLDRFVVSGIVSAIQETDWVLDSRSNSPTEDPTVDYISFTLNISSSSAFNWQADQEIEVFRFLNTGPCNGSVEVVNNDTDPMVTIVTAGGQNSAGTNPGNQFSNIGWADSSSENNYRGNYGEPALCSDSDDDDNDGVINGDEKAIGSDPNSADSDNDGVPDALEIGNDAKNPLDTDSDGTPDIIDGDDDGDGSPTLTEDQNNDNDNNPATDSLDVDGDGIPDYLDANEKDGPSGDVDADGLTNDEELAAGTDPEDSDTDNDGISDANELLGADGNRATTSDNTDPLDADSDDDGLADGAELAGADNNVATVSDNTDPNKLDSDGDGLQDGTELGMIAIIAGGNSEGGSPVAFSGTNSMIFTADTDPGSTTNPNNPDSDNGGDCDGGQEVVDTCFAGEDQNNNGAIDAGESNPLIAADDLGEGVRLQLRTLLQGPYNATSGLMNDSLRTKGVLPVVQPYGVAPTNYTGAETLASALSQVDGNDAVVDWVLLELRDSSKSIIASKAMLVQRDGDIVDGQSGDAIWQPQGVMAGSYYVTIRHRNHLDLITANAIPLSRTPSMVDFSLVTTGVAGNNMRVESGNVALMYTGDINFDQRSIANGPDQDSTTLISSILVYPSNQNFNVNYMMDGYHSGDLNMDGSAIFAGPDNEIDLLLRNILLHPENSTLSANYVINGSLQD